MISPVKVWRRQKEVRKLLGKTGVVISWTKIYAPGVGFQKFAPYAVVLIELTDGEKAIGQLVDYQDGEPKIGNRVMAVLRKIREGSQDGVIAYGVKYKLI